MPAPIAFQDKGVSISFGDALSFYEAWPAPTVIVSDGAYGLNSFPGDPRDVGSLVDWYRPHVEFWSKLALPETTLWFWNSELGWATVHPLLDSLGWEFRNCHIWDKGISHIAGNANTKTLRKFPVTTEVCVQYTKKVYVECDGLNLTLQEWLRSEWRRTGLPLSSTNDACGVKNAATRKYFTSDHLWYFPPTEAFEAFSQYANRFGLPSGRPYFSLDGVKPITGNEWARMRAKFVCDFGLTNVWREPAVRGAERVKVGSKCVHMNQKPLRLLNLAIQASSDKGDVVWEPFGGLCSASLAARGCGRIAYAAESVKEFWDAAVARAFYFDDAALTFPGK